jgi:hypothetical protein
MGRLKFDVSPINRDEGAHGTREENDAWARRCWANWGRKGEPRACDCGYFSDDWLVTCDEIQRVHCRKNLRKRLEYGARQDHERALRKKREFPGPPHDGKGTGWCRWCGLEIINPKTGKRHHLRTWCPSGECLKAYNLHTVHIAQRRYLTARDGEGCKLCGCPDTEVDHVIPLAAVWEAFPEPDRRRWFFSPANLQLLCKGGCHVAKSKADVAFIKACQQNGPGWAKSEVLRRLNAAGLLRIRKDESCCA